MTGGEPKATRPGPSATAPLAPLDAFERATLDAWRAVARGELEVADDVEPLERLARAADGGAQAGLVLPADAREVATIARRPLGDASWCVTEHCDDAQSLATVVEAGANGFWFECARWPAGEWIERASGVSMTGTYWRFGPHADRRTPLQALARLAGSAGLAEFRVDLGADPCSRRAGEGHATGWSEVEREFAEDVRAAERAGALVSGLVVDTRVYQAAGAGPALELGAMLAALVHALRAVEAAGLDARRALGVAAFSLSVDQDLVEECAKLRAARRLVSRVAATLGVALPRAPWIHAVSSLVGHSLRDPWTNALRSGAAAIAAVWADVDALTVEPHDALEAAPSAGGRRLARNMQLVLAHEAQLGAVRDPLAGSYTIESATARLERAGWDAYLRIEAAGGLRTVLDDGRFAQWTAERLAGRARAISSRRRRLVGVNSFPPAEVRALADARESAAPAAGALPAHRDAHAFETLVRRAAARARAGSPVTIALLAVGPAPEHRQRTEFCRELFASLGLDTRTIEVRAESDAVAAAIAAAVADRTSLAVCLSAADARHEAVLLPALERVAPERDVGVLVAGVARSLEARFLAAGALAIVRLGADVTELGAALHAGSGEVVGT